MKHEYDTLLTNIPIKSTQNAKRRLTINQLRILVLLALLVVEGFIWNWHAAIVILIAVLTVLYFSDLLFNLFIVMRSFTKDREVVVSEEEIRSSQFAEWPTYSVLCPLYKEWQVVPQFIAAMEKLDYPEDKLEIILLLEEDDKETIEEIGKMNLPQTLRILVVPHSKPKTKPKALNYALDRIQTEFVVVFDAEDVPDPLQLKKAVIAFEKSPIDIFCMQAKLNFYNSSQNILTRLFTSEYSLWFDLVLTGLQSIDAPIPLGGTSNHFRVADIRALNGWDAYNVTEDADLGMRIAKKQYRTAIFNSTTLEEANSQLLNWFKQRSRWIKGYMQTYFVHMRDPLEFKKDAVTFQLIIGGKILSTIINPIMWGLTITYFVFRGEVGTAIESFFPTIILYMAAFSLIFGNFLYCYYYMLGAAKRNQWDIIPYTIFVPLYWLAMSAAATIAAWEFLMNPFYWQKTKHGLHLKKTDITVQFPAMATDLVALPNI